MFWATFYLNGRAPWTPPGPPEAPGETSAMPGPLTAWRALLDSNQRPTA